MFRPRLSSPRRPRQGAGAARFVSAPVLALPLAFFWLPAAHAQMGMNPTQQMMPTPHRHEEPQTPAPAALPGAQVPQGGSVNQAELENEDPTKVLFSAINKGNYAEARAAVSRGADLQAANALGETPVALSVALGRNAITFMLLSVLHEGGGTTPAAVAAKTGAPKAGATKAGTAKAEPAAGRLSRTGKPHRPTPPQRASAEPVASQRAPAPSGPSAAATPDPAKGFLGFDNNP